MVDSIIGDANHVIILNANGTRPAWTLKSAVTIDVHQIPTWLSEFRIPRHLFCRPQLGHTAFDATHIYPEKDIIVDARTGEIFIFGKRMKFDGDSRGSLYIRGLCQLGPSPVHMNVFADDHLNWKVGFQQKETVRDAKKDAKNQILASFDDKDLAEKAAKLICPRLAIVAW